MVTHALRVDWQRSQDALRDEVGRVTTLLRSIKDPRPHAVGQWNLGEVAMHLSQAWIVVPALARRDLSRVHDVIPGIVGDSLVTDMWQLGEVTKRGVRSDPERDPAVLADRIEQRAQEYFGECAGHSPDELRSWLVEGTRVPLSALTGHLLNETLVHGYDIARAAGRDWRIEPTHVAMLPRQFFMPVMQATDSRTFANGKKAVDFRATYDVRLRGHDQFHFVFDDGSVRIEEPSSRRVDCHISADPVAFVMVYWDRQSQWTAIAKGKLLAWGRKPWLGPRFRTLLRNP
ncbi:MAG: maleylpyruvate isomerase N-terminal domain-containing protein [Actinomycetota bacterium]|nr:maleylpyruvate isomerase N-terminal domain-containing protein [Actinomycetota bacterium]